MNPLCEITDGDEIAALLGQLQDEKANAPTRAFGSLFQSAKRQMSGDTEEDETQGGDSAGEAEGSETPAPVDAEAADADDPAITETRGEIGGLMAKIRLLSSHFRKG